MEQDPREQAMLHLQTGRPEQARELLRSVAALNPTDGATQLLLAQAEVMLGDRAAAEGHARAATGDADTRAAAFHALATLIALDEHRAGEAVEAAASAVRLEPDDWSHRAVLATCLADARQIADALAQAEAAVQLAPPDPAERSGALVALARVCLTDPAHRSRGYRVMREAAALDPTDPALQQQVMIAQFQTGRRAEAIGTALTSLRMTPRAAVPPLIARLSAYLLARRVVGWLLIVSFAVPLVFLGIIGGSGDPSLLETGPALVARLGGAVGLLGFAAVFALTLRPLRDPSTARAVWRFARRSALLWFDAILVGLAVLNYLLALVLGELYPPGVPLPFLLLLVTRVVHGWGGIAFRVPDTDTLLARR
ncbi:MAG: hypothetical protein QM602_01195 [Microbacterium sp.]